MLRCKFFQNSDEIESINQPFKFSRPLYWDWQVVSDVYMEIKGPRITKTILQIKS